MEVFPALGLGDGHNVFALRHHPRQGGLCRSALFFTSDFACTLDEIEIALEIFALKSRGLPPVIILRQIVERFFIAVKLPPIFALSSRAKVLRQLSDTATGLKARPRAAVAGLRYGFDFAALRSE
jgi:hypothetical protein